MSLTYLSKPYSMEKYLAGIVCISERKLAINDHCPFLVNSHCGLTQSSRCPGRHVLCAPQPYHAKASFVIPFLPAVDKGHIVPEVCYIRIYTVIPGVQEDGTLLEYRSLMSTVTFNMVPTKHNTKQPHGMVCIGIVVNRQIHAIFKSRKTRFQIVPLGLPN